MDLKRSRVAPWSAAIAGASGWALHQQLLGDLQHFHCGYSGAWVGAIVTLAVLGLVGLGVALSLAARGDANPTRRFIVQFSLLCAAVFLVPILMQGGATLMLPPCQP
jgi:hypothetical protein